MSNFQAISIDFVAISDAVAHIPFRNVIDSSKLGIARGILASAPTADNATPEDFQREIDDIRSKLGSIISTIQGASTQLDKDVIGGAHASIDGLVVADQKLYDIATFIKGKYDSRDVDEVQKAQLLNSAVKAFEDVQAVSEDGLKKIGDAHARITDIEQSNIIPLQDRIDVISKQNQTYLTNIRDSITNSENSVREFQNSLAKESDAINTLQSKISNSESAATISDIGFTIITFGIGNAINHGPLDPFNLHGQLDDARRARDEAQNRLNEANNQLTKLRNSLALLQVRLSMQKQLQDSLPGVQLQAKEALSKTVMLENQFTPLKETSTKLLLNIRRVQASAIVVSTVAYTKKEFATGLLTAAEDSLIDSHLVEPSQKIEREIMDNYGSAIPAEIQAITDVINQKIEVLIKVQSVKAIAGT